LLLQQRPLRGLLPGVQITVGSAVASSGSARTSGAIGFQRDESLDDE
jgi:hypothetical protein